MADEERKVIELRNQLSFLCAGMHAKIVASAMADLMVEIYTEYHPSPSLEDYLEQMRATYEHYVAQERKSENH